jgi:hypothetical protein
VRTGQHDKNIYRMIRNWGGAQPRNHKASEAMNATENQYAEVQLLGNMPQQTYTRQSTSGRTLQMFEANFEAIQWNGK